MATTVSRSKALSWPEITHRATVFAGEWADAAGDERRQSQLFWVRFLECFGIRPERVATFEHTVQRFSTQAHGFIDLFWPGMLLVEQKSAGADLEKAKFQAFDYLGGLKDHELPRLVVMCDFRRFRGQVLATGEEFEFALDELPDPANLDRFGFIAGYSRAEFGNADEEAASVKAAQLMSSLYEQLRLDQYPDEAASVFLTRLLFLMFGDDTGLWEPALFTEYVRTRTAEDGSDLGAQLSALFQVLDTDIPGRPRHVDDVAARFPYVNGDLYAKPLQIPYFDTATRDVLLQCCAFDWGDISPAVFGSMFQAVKSKAARRELGEHYTTETNILKTVRPLLLDGLRERFERVRGHRPSLQKLLDDLAEIRVLDPACGCGNFLVVTYRELRQLELDIRVRMRELAGSTQGEFVFAEHLAIGIDQFYGIELEWWPAKIAEVAMFLVDHRANQTMARQLGWAPNRLPLTIKPTIRHDNALTTDWTQVLPPAPGVVILGNPPFLGHDTRTPAQATELRTLWGRDIGRIDYVTGWYAKALDYFDGTPGGRWAFVSTNSVTQGQPVPLVFGRVLAAGWRIAFAHRTFAWQSEAPGAASVHCVIIGFTRDPAIKPRLFDYTSLRGEPIERTATNINPYLIDGADLLVAARSTPIAPDLHKISYGSRPNDGGAFIIDPADLPAFRADPHAAPYLRQLIGARELLNGNPRWALWLKNVDQNDAAHSHLLRERLERCRQHRLDSDRAATRDWADRPHLFDFDSQPNSAYLCIPSVSSETRRYMASQRFEPEVISTNAVFTTPDPDGLHFAVLSSSMFMAWQKAIGGRLKSDIRFSNTLVWNNFPLPALTDQQRQKIVDAGRGVLTARELHPDRTLAEHYNSLVTDSALRAAHAHLDHALDPVFGAKKASLSESERQALLFSSYRNLQEADMLAAPTSTRRRSRTAS